MATVRRSVNDMGVFKIDGRMVAFFGKSPAGVQASSQRRDKFPGQLRFLHELVDSSMSAAFSSRILSLTVPGPTIKSNIN